jgi:hypothetical protein
MQVNVARRTRNIWAVIILLAVSGIFAPFLFGMDEMDGGFAIAFLSFFLAITGLIVVIMYHGRAKTLDGILSGNDLLTHWTYSPEVWKNYAEVDFHKDTHSKWSLYRLVMVVAAVVCLIASLVLKNAWPAMIGVFLGLGGLLAAVVLLTTRHLHRQNRQYLGEAYISRKGIYLNRQLHIWSGWGGKLESAVFNESEGLLEVSYSLPDRTGRSNFTVRVPVPPEESAKARRIAVELGGLRSASHLVR